MMKVDNLKNSNGGSVANQFVISDGDKTVFQSYDSVICTVSGDTLTIGGDWDYSMTTRRHFYAFLNHHLRGVNVRGSDDINKAIVSGTLAGYKVVYKPSMA